MDMKTLWRDHPQKFCLKMYSTFIYYLGGGNCWYTKKRKTKPASMLYNLYAVTINGLAFLGYLNEVLAKCRPLTVKERNDVIQFDLAHGTMFAKFIVFYLQKSRIKALLERFLEDDRQLARLDIDKESAKRALKFSCAIQGTLYATLLTGFLDGIRMHIKDGIPIRTEVVYFPNPSQSGFYINVLRVFVELHRLYLMNLMGTIDSISMCFMVFLAAKFKHLTVHFEELQKKLLANVGKKSLEELDKIYKDDFIVGIQLHQHTLWYADRIQYALGNIYSIQVLQTMFLLIMCLVKLVVLEKNLTFLVASMVYMSCVVIQLGSYMVGGGSVTYEASLVPNGIYNSGWELTSCSRKLRSLIVVAMIRSQRPVVMTSFGLLELSYANFIAVIKSSYSFFTVMY